MRFLDLFFSARRRLLCKAEPHGVVELRNAVYGAVTSTQMSPRAHLRDYEQTKEWRNHDLSRAKDRVCRGERFCPSRSRSSKFFESPKNRRRLCADCDRARREVKGQGANEARTFLSPLARWGRPAAFLGSIPLAACASTAASSLDFLASRSQQDQVIDFISMVYFIWLNILFNLGGFSAKSPLTWKGRVDR